MKTLEQVYSLKSCNELKLVHKAMLMCDICTKLVMKTPERRPVMSFKCLYYQFETDFIHCFSVYVCDFGNVFVCLRALNVGLIKIVIDKQLDI